MGLFRTSFFVGLCALLKLFHLDDTRISCQRGKSVSVISFLISFPHHSFTFSRTYASMSDMKLVIFLSLNLIIHGFQPAQFTLTQMGYEFHPANSVELLDTFSNIRRAISCAILCYGHRLCRTFHFNADTHSCRLFEGAMDTGVLVPTASVDVVGSIKMHSSTFTLFNASSQLCTDDRFLSSDASSGLCQCPIHTVWNGSMCLNQRFNGGFCINENWCRMDVGLTCVASLCTGTTC